MPRASRRGLILSKSGRRDPDGLDFGLYALKDARTGKIVHAPGSLGKEFVLTLDEVEAALTKPAKE